MDIQRRRFLRLALNAALLAPARPLPARAQPYPSRAVRIVVGFPAAGPLDIAARTIAPFLSSRFGQDFVVENRPGASGNTATSEVVRTAPDGHTLALVHFQTEGAMAPNPKLLSDDWLATDGIRASGRQHPV